MTEERLSDEAREREQDEPRLDKETVKDLNPREEEAEKIKGGPCGNSQTK